ncbi:SsrA-binding protein SmpB [Candidatus Dependentiae bacterium]|nr:SsrA-binding protein SmpB [Candidatus Dependentiae bacterium]
MKILSTNKEAYFSYNILETFHAGIALTGDEVKSIRRGFGGLKDAFVTIHEGQAQVINWYITPYSHAYEKQSALKSDGRRSRVLLLSRKEINQIFGAISRKGLTVVALKLYLSDKNLVKMEIGTARHKTLVDKREKVKQREADRELKTALKYKNT